MRIVIALSLAALVVLDGGKGAGSMKVQIRIEVRRVELLQQLGAIRGNVAVADMFADDSPVFAFHEGIVLTAAGARTSELDP